MSNGNQMSMAQLISDLLFEKKWQIELNKSLSEDKEKFKAKNDKLQTEIDRLKTQLEYSDISKVNTMALVQELSERKNVTFESDSGRTLSGLEPQSEPRILIKIY